MFLVSNFSYSRLSLEYRAKIEDNYSNIKSSQYSKLSRDYRCEGVDGRCDDIGVLSASPEGYEGVAISSCREK